MPVEALVLQLSLHLQTVSNTVQGLCLPSLSLYGCEMKSHKTKENMKCGFFKRQEGCRCCGEVCHALSPFWALSGDNQHQEKVSEAPTGLLKLLRIYLGENWFS